MISKVFATRDKSQETESFEDEGDKSQETFGFEDEGYKSQETESFKDEGYKRSYRASNLKIRCE